MIAEGRSAAATTIMANRPWEGNGRSLCTRSRPRSARVRLLDALQELGGRRQQSAGRTNLFSQPEARPASMPVALLSGSSIATGSIGSYGWNTEPVTLDDLVKRHASTYGLAPPRRDEQQVRRRLEALEGAGSRRVPALRTWSPGPVRPDPGEISRSTAGTSSDDLNVNRLGTLARCSQVIADYEAARRRSAPIHDNPRTQRGANDRGSRSTTAGSRPARSRNWCPGDHRTKAFRGRGNNFTTRDAGRRHHHPQGEGSSSWPIVFVPGLSDKRFPSSRTGSARDWRILDRPLRSGAVRGTTENDERRLFYAVAVTRAAGHPVALDVRCAFRLVQKPSRFFAETHR